MSKYNNVKQRCCIHLRRGLLLGGGTGDGGEGRCRGGGGAGGRGTARTAPPSPPPASARAAPWRDTSRPSSWLARSLGGRPHLCTWHHWPLSHGLLTSSTPHYHCHSLALDQAADFYIMSAAMSHIAWVPETLDYRRLCKQQLWLLLSWEVISIYCVSNIKFRCWLWAWLSFVGDISKIILTFSTIKLSNLQLQ